MRCVAPDGGGGQRVSCLYWKAEGWVYFLKNPMNTSMSLTGSNLRFSFKCGEEPQATKSLASPNEPGIT